jgi:hypothetical protein
VVLSLPGPPFIEKHKTKVMDSIMVKDDHHHHHHHHNHHSSDYGNNPWGDISDYHSPHTQSPATEFHTYGFIPSQQHALPLEPSFNRPMAPVYSTAQTQQSMFTAQWPSMLTNPSSQSAPSMPAPPPPVAPVTTYTTATPLPPLTTTTHAPHQTSSRRTLTDQDRRRMCQYHEDHPNVKQTEIGGK